MNKQEIAEYFEVSVVTVGNWLSRGMPYIRKGAKGRDYEFDLDSVIKWRDQRLQAECTPALSDAPECVQKRPDWLNGLRFISEDSVGHFLWYFINHDEGMRLMLAQFHDAGCTHEKAYSELQTFIFALYSAFSEWVTRDRYFTDAWSGEMSVDEYWNLLAREKIRTHPPIDPDRIVFNIPDWTLMKAKDYVEQYWPESREGLVT